MARPHGRAPLLLALASACSSSPSTPDAGALDAALPTGPVSDFCDAFVDAIGDRLASCYGGDRAYYRRIRVPFGEESCAEVQKDADEGRRGFDPSAAAECLALIATASCADVYPTRRDAPDSICDRAITGAVPVGVACSSNHCVSGSHCQIPDGSCTGACELDRARGEPCREDDECAADLVCRIAPPLASKSCQPLIAGGTEEDCRDDLDCAFELYCDRRAPAAPRCQPQLTAGSTCASSLACAPGLLCAGRPGARACRPIRGLGAPCAPDERECGFGYCGADRTCHPEPELGAACGATGGEIARCSAEAFCGGSGTCVPKRAAGEPCSTFQECASRACEDAQCAAVSCPPP